MRCPTLIAGLFLALAVPLYVSADQEDVRLDALFARLQEAESRQAVESLTRRIWRIWRSHEDSRVAMAMAKGARAVAADRFERAEAHFDRVVDMAPDYAEGWNQRATVRYLRGRLVQSAADIHRVLALEPRHFGALEGLGMIYLELDQPRAALEAFRRALEVNPHLPGARDRIEMLGRQGVGEPS